MSFVRLSSSAYGICLQMHKREKAKTHSNVCTSTYMYKIRTRKIYVIYLNEKNRFFFVLTLFL